MALTSIDQDAILTTLDQLIHQTVAEVQTVSKYGGTLYTLNPDQKEGQFCGVFPYKDHVQLAFSKGAALDDPAGVLSGTGKHRRHVNFTDVADVDAAAITALLTTAAALSKG